MEHYINTLLLFLPAGIANAFPLIANKIPGLNQWNTPLDMGVMVRGKRLMGKNKTWRGLLSGVLAGGLCGILIYPHLSSNNSVLAHFLLGSILGFGALFGDAVESFFKRQRDIASGNSLLVFDQIDYVIGAVVFSLPFVQLQLWDYIVVFAMYFLLHFVVTYIGFLLGFKEKPI